MYRAIPAVLLAAFLVVTAAPPSRATIYCYIRKTDDGFVALRDGPSAKAKMIEKMTSDGEVLVGLGKVGKWIEVTYWRGGRFASGKNDTGDPYTARGWMHEDFIDNDSCG